MVAPVCCPWSVSQDSILRVLLGDEIRIIKAGTGDGGLLTRTLRYRRYCLAGVEELDEI